MVQLKYRSQCVIVVGKPTIKIYGKYYLLKYNSNYIVSYCSHSVLMN